MVEVDETLVGGIDRRGKRGCGSQKSIIVIAVELHKSKGFGRIRMRYIPDASSESLANFIYDVIQPSSTICTDGWSGYNDIKSFGYYHEVTVQSTSKDQAHVSMTGVYNVVALLKRWILGTHQGAFAAYSFTGILGRIYF